MDPFVKTLFLGLPLIDQSPVKESWNTRHNENMLRESLAGRQLRSWPVEEASFRSTSLGVFPIQDAVACNNYQRMSFRRREFQITNFTLVHGYQLKKLIPFCIHNNRNIDFLSQYRVSRVDAL